MQINKFTDYGFRVLIYLARQQECTHTIASLAKQLHLSQNHLVKIVHFMAKQQWLITSRGKGGGIRLAESTLDLPLGEMLRTFQGNEPLVNCVSPKCGLQPQCQLKHLLDNALEQFYQNLNQYPLRKVISNHSQDRINFISYL
ncbi:MULTISPECIES: RrF2 family transcriptional regulator [Avibacterium]|uniref:HTH-type transcriptional repressor NsrR n=2 Tax=Avibacterium TaxID=292486 RepID=A0A0F5EUZ1_AVIPA|nr:Rrf2 family transcriptional regulator [Avibacterium paragallinarum]VGM95770.1 HTH-type transcriptional repressor NsrR [uncultured Avibacterium sp.]AZI13611.1 Rrf2 family transcriptional regulator [Avibacterium paragallinarum]KAA6208896.1 Rrf2 family transcriptional regulator [Avibacterium paragallinarum]KKB01279.1 transcriptional regulator [Avibacterium paragallinarum]MEE3609411.1 Rrf2 family transcriptional regulator [Avibacterium paragallinarum]